jgi:hypothetical protein
LPGRNCASILLTDLGSSLADAIRPPAAQPVP